MIKKISLILIGLLLSAVLLEMGLRVSAFIYLYLQEQGNKRSLNNKGTYRILCFGESTTMSQYPKYLEEELNNRNIGTKFSVIDKGRGGTTTNYIVANLSEDIDKFKPDMVITMMGINDARSDVAAVEDERGYYRKLRTYKLMKLIELHMKSKLAEIKNAESSKAVKIDENGGGEADRVLSAEDRYVKKGHYYMGIVNYKEAEKMYKKALVLNPKKAEVYVYLGDCYRFQERFKEAEYPYKKAIELNPPNLEWAYINIGYCYNLQKEYKETEDVCRKAVKLNPKQRYALYLLSIACESQKKYDEAANVLKELAKLEAEGEGKYDEDIGIKYKKIQDETRSLYFSPATIYNYIRLRKILKERNVAYVCMQYPMRKIDDLKGIFVGDKGVFFVDNENIFKDAIRKEGPTEYFRDMFGKDFGHCTHKGNKLLARNIADTIIREVFHK